MLTEGTGATKPVAVIIVGADALLAARPATPIQLWHACVAAGYDLAVPATWGDELIAGESLRTLGAHPEQVAVMCTCPMVARTLADMPFDLSGNLVSTVAPPVAAAKYLRRVYGERRVHITYAGECPAAADSAIDAWITPAELLARFRETGIVLEEQPELFESILPPDRRRHLSQPGGLPSVDQVAKMARPRRVQHVEDADLVAAIERHLSSGVRTLVDLAPRAGCACSGASAEVVPADARATVAMLEPPRSSRPVMADPGGLGLSRRLPVRQPTPTIETPQRPQIPFAPTTAAKPERERPAVVATRAATLSPLSWHLRDRAHPQPPTTPRPESRRAPDTGRPVGASSAAWASAASGSALPAEPAPDAVTAAAVRALEHAAAVRASGVTKDRDGTGSAAPHSGISTTVAREAIEPVSPGDESVSHATPNLEPAAPESPAREPENVAGAGSGEPRTQRATPPGGYWFAAPIVSAGSDMEVRRPSTPADVVPDDSDSRDPHDAQAPDEVDVPTDAPAAVSRHDDEDAPPPVGENDRGSSAESAPPLDGPPAEGESEAVEPLDDVRAELAELFGSSKASEAAPAPAPVPPGAESDSNVPVAVPASAAPVAGVTRPSDTPGPLPWKWLIGAALLIVAAVFVTRRINSRVTTEESGTSVLTGGSAGTEAPSGLFAPPALLGGEDAVTEPSATDSTTMRTVVPGARANPPRIRRGRAAQAAPLADSAARTPTAAAGIVARDTTARLGAVRDSVRRDSVAGDTTPVVAAPPPTAREIELQAIREELARRTARLDSMGRAIGSLYVAPRRPPGVPSRPPPPPAFRDPRENDRG